MSSTGILTDDEAKALYAAYKLKAGPTEVSGKLGLKLSTYFAQLKKATTKIEAAFPGLKESLDGGAGEAAPAAATPKKRGRKKKADDAETPTPKKTKISAAVKTEDGVAEDGTSTKKENAEEDEDDE